MAISLYPPIVDDILPAFYAETKEMGEKGWFQNVTISFALNRLVAPNQVKTIMVRYKKLDDTKIAEQSYTFNKKNMVDESNYELRLTYNFDQASSSTVFNHFTAGQYYKIQIACVAAGRTNETTIYWSTDALFKYMGYAEVRMPSLQPTAVNQLWDTVEGQFIHEQDPTETEYAYRFWIQDEKNEIVKETGWQYYNGEADTLRFYEELKTDKIYFLYYQVQTVNNQIFTTRGYPVKQSYDIPIQGQEKYWSLVAEPDQENGRVIVNLKYIQSESQKNKEGYYSATDYGLVDGNFRIVKYNGRNWYEIERFKIEMAMPVSLSFIDDVVDNEWSYMYALQEFNIDEETGKIKVISERFAISNMVKVHLEYMFLSDKNRVLKVKYNPKVSSYKMNVLEQKQETIGSKYPFFFRNPVVGYREFNLSGLISYLADEDQMFIWFGDRGANKVRRATTPSIPHSNGGTATDLTASNIYDEWYFRENVLEWLNDGEIKLLRTPTEGTFLVRCMNTSLTPEDTLGRMLYTFSTTATEAMEVNYPNLDSLGFYHKFGKVLRGDGTFVFWRSTNWQDVLELGIGQSLLPPTVDGSKFRRVRQLRIQDFEFGDKFKIILDNGVVKDNEETATIKIHSDSGETTEEVKGEYEIIINKTGNYFIDYPVKDVQYMGNIYRNSRNNLKTGIIAFEIEAYTLQIFKWIESSVTHLVPYTQIIGSAVEPDEKDNTYSYNLIEGLDDVKYTARLRYMRFYVDDYLTRLGLQQSGRTPVQNKNGNDTFDIQEGQGIINKLNTKIRIQLKGAKGLKPDPDNPGQYIDDIREIDVATVNQDLIIDTNSYYLTLTEILHYFEINDIRDVAMLEIGNGVTAELSFYVIDLTYTPELSSSSSKYPYFKRLNTMMKVLGNILQFLPQTNKQARREIIKHNHMDTWSYEITEGWALDGKEDNVKTKTVEVTGVGLAQWFNWFSKITRTKSCLDEKGKFKIGLLKDNFHTHIQSTASNFFVEDNYSMYNAKEGSYTLDLLQFLWEHTPEWQEDVQINGNDATDAKYQIASKYIKDLYLQLYNLWYVFDISSRVEDREVDKNGSVIEANNIFRCQNAVKNFIRYVRKLYVEYLEYCLYSINEYGGV